MFLESIFQKIKIADIGRLFIFVSFLFLVSGCNQGGMNFGDVVNGAVTYGSYDDGDGNTTSDGDQDGDTYGDDENSIVKIHNPEPASMILWGVGIAGAALLRRRRRNSSADA